MNSNYQLFALHQMWLPLVIAAAISGIYFAVSVTQPTLLRLFGSSHGIWLLLAGAYAVAISPWSGGASMLYSAPFLILLALFLISLIYSFFQYRGRRAAVHVLQIALLPSAIWIFFVGAMTISHDWM